MPSRAKTPPLSDLDLRILSLLSRHRVMTQTQLAAVSPETPVRTLRYRCSRLARQGLLGRTRPYRERGSAPNHLWPTRRGEATACGGAPPRGGERREPILSSPGPHRRPHRGLGGTGDDPARRRTARPLRARGRCPRAVHRPGDPQGNGPSPRMLSSRSPTRTGRRSSPSSSSTWGRCRTGVCVRRRRDTATTPRSRRGGSAIPSARRSSSSRPPRPAPAPSSPPCTGRRARSPSS